MQHYQGTFAGANNLPLFYQSWRSATSHGTHHLHNKAIVTLVHGLGSYSDEFHHVVDYLVERNYVVYGIDLRGHGRSPGQRGYINRWTELRTDLGCLVEQIREREGDLPLFLYGHSLGAVVVLDYVLHFPQDIAGVITTAPALKQVGVPPIRMLLGKILSQIYPRFSLSTGISKDAASHDPTVVQTYSTDPLRHCRGTARLATEFVATTDWLRQHAGDLQVPLLILHGGCDRVTSPQISREFFEKVTVTDKTFVEYPESYHDLHDEVNYLEFLADVHGWLEHHVTALVISQS